MKTPSFFPQKLSHHFGMMNSGVIQHQDDETIRVTLFENPQEIQKRCRIGRSCLIKNCFAIMDVNGVKQRYVSMMAERRHLLLTANL
ncbi:hypothetical protein AVP43_01192 [Geobacillus stearothermophilus]|nr:hypothetical protein AVP43_01192 [Geobacillus stearothermophilus]